MQMGMNRFQRVQQWLVFARQWHIADANGQDIDMLGDKVARYLKGAHKPIYHPESRKIVPLIMNGVALSTFS